MTFAEILETEDRNTQYLFLYSEGGFIKLYEHSAYLFHTHVKDFKLSCRFIKTVNRFVVSLGFPANSLEKWLGQYPIRQVSDKLQVCDFGHKVDEVEYHNWFELARSLANPADKYTRQTGLIERQPVYKTVYDQYLDILRLSKNFARHIRIPLGDDTKLQLHLICRSIRENLTNTLTYVADPYLVVAVKNSYRGHMIHFSHNKVAIGTTAKKQHENKVA